MLLNVSVVVPQVSLFCCFFLHVECLVCLSYAYLCLPLGVSVFFSNANSERCDEQKPSFLFPTGGSIVRCLLQHHMKRCEGKSKVSSWDTAAFRLAKEAAAAEKQ